MGCRGKIQFDESANGYFTQQSAGNKKTRTDAVRVDIASPGSTPAIYGGTGYRLVRLLLAPP
jgi:hypothetical protein